MPPHLRLLPAPETAPSWQPTRSLDNGFHELMSSNTGAETTTLAFAMSLAARAANRTEQGICFCSLATEAQECGLLYGHGVTSFGLLPDRLLMVAAAKEKHLLWALEEALVSKAFGAVIGALGPGERLYGFPASRRLKLRVVETGTPLYLLRHHSRSGATAAHGRWRITPTPSRADGAHAGFELPGPSRLRLSLEKMGGLPPQQWEMEYDGTRGFHMAAVLPDRTDRATEPGRRQAV